MKPLFSLTIFLFSCTFLVAQKKITAKDIPGNYKIYSIKFMDEVVYNASKSTTGNIDEAAMDRAHRKLKAADKSFAASDSAEKWGNVELMVLYFLFMEFDFEKDKSYNLKAVMEGLDQDVSEPGTWLYDAKAGLMSLNQNSGGDPLRVKPYRDMNGVIFLIMGNPGDWIITEYKKN